MLCFFKAEPVVDPLSWKIQVSDGKPLPAKFKMQSGELVFVSARNSVGENSVRLLKLYVSVHELNFSERSKSDHHSEGEGPTKVGFGNPTYFGPPLDWVTKTPLRVETNGDYFQS